MPEPSSTLQEIRTLRVRKPSKITGKETFSVFAKSLLHVTTTGK